MVYLAFDFGIVKSTVCDTIILVENVLIQNRTFRLLNKKTLLGMGVKNGAYFFGAND